MQAPNIKFLPKKAFSTKFLNENRIEHTIAFVKSHSIITGFKYSYQIQNWTNPNHGARNKVRNNKIPLRYYAATTPLRLAS